MKTQPASGTVELSTPSRSPVFAENILSNVSPVITSPLSGTEQKIRMRDSLSFSICFAVIAVLTGAMLFARVAVTVSVLTSALFYLSLGGMVAFAARAIVLARQKAVSASDPVNLN